MIAIQIKGIGISYDAQSVLYDLSFELEEKSIVHLSGPSGSGKTTLLRCVAGLESINSGEIGLFGRTVQSGNILIPPNKRGIGMVFQDLILFPHMTVFQNVDFVSKAIFNKKSRRLSWTHELLAKLKISHKAQKYPHELSGGEKQRVAIARALAHRPKILLLDEPFSHLDADLKKSISDDLLNLIRDEDLTAIIVSHMVENEQNSGVVSYEMKNGKIWAVDS